MVITVDLLKKIEFINSNESYDDTDKNGYIIAEVLKWNYDKVNNLSSGQYLSIIKKINKSIYSRLPFWKKSISIITDANKLTFGQFVDLQHFYKQPEYVNYETIFARLCNKSIVGIEKAKEKVLKTDVRKILKKYNDFKVSYDKLMKSNADLFGINQNEDVVEGLEKEKTHPFINAFGWVFSAESIAEYYKIETQKVYDLNIIEAISALNYLKAKGEYLKTQT